VTFVASLGYLNNKIPAYNLVTIVARLTDNFLSCTEKNNKRFWLEEMKQEK